MHLKRDIQERSNHEDKSYQLSENQIKVRNNRNASVFSSVLTVT